jgi:hypothetical protein
MGMLTAPVAPLAPPVGPLLPVALSALPVTLAALLVAPLALPVGAETPLLIEAPIGVLFLALRTEGAAAAAHLSALWTEGAAAAAHLSAQWAAHHSRSPRRYPLLCARAWL